MQIIPIAKFKQDDQTEIVSLLPPTKAFTPMVRLIADENCFLTDGVSIHSSLDVLSSEQDNWQELLISDYSYLFK